MADNAHKSCATCIMTDNARCLAAIMTDNIHRSSANASTHGRGTI